jgi:hypothetical protein
MPTQTGQDTQGCYARWGNHGKKYYYKCGDKAARERAKDKADAQGRAAHAHGYGKKTKLVGGFRTN